MRILIVFGLVVALMVVSGGILYQRYGLDEFIRAVGAINGLSGEGRDKARQDFWGPDDKKVYSGILAHVATQGFGGVWVWGKWGPRYFASDEYSVYSFFGACTPDKLGDLQKEGKVRIGRTIETEIETWQGRVKPGNFVVVVVAGEGSGGERGKLREARAYDWWVFMPVNIGEQCKR